MRGLFHVAYKKISFLKIVISSIRNFYPSLFHAIKNLSLNFSHLSQNVSNIKQEKKFCWGIVMPLFLPCPTCGSHRYYQSRPRNFIEKIRRQFIFQQAYRCHECGARNWIQTSVKLPTLSRRRLTLLSIILFLGFIISHLINSFM